MRDGEKQTGRHTHRYIIKDRNYRRLKKDVGKQTGRQTHTDTLSKTGTTNCKLKKDGMKQTGRQTHTDAPSKTEPTDYKLLHW